MYPHVSIDVSFKPKNQLQQQLQQHFYGKSDDDN